MFNKLTGIAARFDELDRLMADPAVSADYAKVATFAQERAQIADIVAAYRDYERKRAERDDAAAMAEAEADDDMRAMAKAEVEQLGADLVALEGTLRTLLLPRDPRDDKNVIMEIRAGAGGDEAALFAADLFRMYSRYAETQRWKTDVEVASDTGHGGLKLITFVLKGKGAFSRLKYESGVHRVQRVPETEAQGRIHTSTVTVAVLAEMDALDINLNMNDVRVDVFRASGAGGQHVNKTESAVRMTHIPTGIVAESQDERSQHQNRMRCVQILANRLYEYELEKQRSERESERRSMVGTGDRSEKIRTYNYPQNRITDHRINFSIYNLPEVMNGSGSLGDLFTELATRDQAERLGAAAPVAETED